jgi:hypothetical protein
MMVAFLLLLPPKIPLRISANIVSAAIFYASCFNAFMFWSVYTGSPVTANVLYPLTALNGVATGCVQTLSSRMGGDLPTTKTTAVGSLQLVGVALAQWLPGLIQVPTHCLEPGTPAA